MADMSSYERFEPHRVSHDEFKATGSGAVNQDVNIDNGFFLDEIRLHLDAAATQEDFVITLISNVSSVYNTVLYRKTMSDAGGVQDIVWRPEIDTKVGKDFILRLTWTNTDATTWGLSVLLRRDS